MTHFSRFYRLSASFFIQFRLCKISFFALQNPILDRDLIDFGNFCFEFNSMIAEMLKVFLRDKGFSRNLKIA